MKADLSFQNIILNHLNAPEDMLLAQQVAELRLQSPAHEKTYQEVILIWDTAILTKKLDGID
ncbi:MAG: hypothetical protein MUP99_12945, partial [Pedobacter sp.]|nr:hypothetical protein [Pedobacter sp.]